MSYLLVAGGILCFACGQTDAGGGLLGIGMVIWLFTEMHRHF